MKLSIVYNPSDNKLLPTSYCGVFRGMFNALISRFETVQHITESGSADDIDGDMIFFFDPHSSHHIQLDGINRHPALKMEYWNDPHQNEVWGMYKSSGTTVHKLGKEQRVKRAEARGIDFIVSSVKYRFYDYFAPYWSAETMKQKMVHFPPAPCFEPNATPISERNHEVLANGATWGSNDSKDPYLFRKWAYSQPGVTFVAHAANDAETPQGDEYGDFLGQYAGALALCDSFPVVKYYEIPLAGCVVFAQYHPEYQELGFRDNETCIYVDKSDFSWKIKHFIKEIGSDKMQSIADSGRKLISEHYTADHFAEFVYQKCFESKAIAV